MTALAREYQSNRMTQIPMNAIPNECNIKYKYIIIQNHTIFIFFSHFHPSHKSIGVSYQVSFIVEDLMYGVAKRI